jgi:hypothetical protein
MVRKKPPDAQPRGEPLVRKASDPDREPGAEDTAVVPGEERPAPRTRKQPEPDDDLQ